jgi:hypothetical protein
VQLDARLGTVDFRDALRVREARQLVAGSGPDVQDDAAGGSEERRESGRDVVGEFLAEGEPELGEGDGAVGFEVCDEDFGRREGGLEEVWVLL